MHGSSPKIHRRASGSTAEGRQERSNVDTLTLLSLPEGEGKNEMRSRDDINVDYLRTAAGLGLPVVGADSVLPFLDRSFDSVLIFEVIEHVPNVEKLLAEAFRVARKNVLVTVPNSENIDLMKQNDVTYAHMLSSDHLHFFDPVSLESLLRRYSNNVSIERSDPILPFWFVGRSLPFYGMKLLFRLGVFKPRFFSRLYAVASVREN